MMSERPKSERGSTRFHQRRWLSAVGAAAPASSGGPVNLA